MKNLFSKLSRDTLKNCSALFCFWGDLVICLFIYKRFSDKAYFEKMWVVIIDQYQQLGTPIPNDMKDPIYHMMLNSLVLMIILIVLVHSFTYFFYLRDKKFAHAYIRILSFVGVPGAFFMTTSYFSTYPYFGILFVIQTLMFAFVAYGCILHPWQPDYKRKKKVVT